MIHKSVDGGIREARQLGAGRSLAQGCLSKPGYIALSDTDWVGVSTPRWGQTTPSKAEALCNFNSGCTIFDNTGFYNTGNIRSFEPRAGVCTYVKNQSWGTDNCACETTWSLGTDTYAGCVDAGFPGKPWILLLCVCLQKLAPEERPCP
ncbi:hypothetical protein HXX76_008484 [Chlamydomonas incerta]|uniref:Uncharacterized protein n=1 Tax=Chlamydomonas incerta TaxID=51695 RepID=A0A835SX84_CHLIN|nr:hypothetical protein HXX76_008484 [Chlamydomonas incerta]|eukprot:KAG2433426.1 hypothetical protein HXX76_008484 [Chlamydomonas incerta]